MVLRPGLGVHDDETHLQAMPWLERRRIGTVKAWFMMIGRAMSSPRRLARAVPPEATGPSTRAMRDPARHRQRKTDRPKPAGRSVRAIQTGSERRR